MPILSKFRIRTPLDEFENFLGEEMNPFSGFFSESSVEEGFTNEPVESTQTEAEIEIEVAPKGNWRKKIHSIFKFSSDLFL